ncbi:MAG: hypothetical protein L0H73_11750 [Nitrococcus sp.]|nr:hypothetical protein [Nitrococcus sp.]
MRGYKRVAVKVVDVYGNEAVIEVATAPGQVVPIRPGREILQARRSDPNTGREYVVRVVVDTAGKSDTVVTAYRSSKLKKYWRTE